MKKTLILIIAAVFSFSFTPPKDSIAGKHGFTIQWLSWDKNKWGTAVIKKSTNEWYTIEGEQKNADGWVTISGKIKLVGPKELSFDGTITYEINSINNGKQCKKEGLQTFLSTKGRKYWRMQDMNSCEGGTTDYVDIYF